MIRWIIYLFGSGLIFFIGAGCVLLGAGLFRRSRHRWQLLLANVVCVLGAVLVSLSSTPLGTPISVVVGIATGAMLVAEQLRRDGVRSFRIWAVRLTVVGWLVAVAQEIPFQIVPRLTLPVSPPLFVIADSISAGVGEPGVETWPKLLARTQQITVHDFSRMGATVATADAQAARLGGRTGVILIELGGNDVLGTTQPAEYERGLDQLLSRVCGAGRTVVMFEVPLPPLANSFGQIQRRLAVRYHVILIPKRILIGVLTAPAATSDSIHLTQVGHNQMARVVWDLIRTAYEPR